MVYSKIPGTPVSQRTAYFITCVLLFFLGQSCFKDLPNKHIVYQNDFEKQDTSHLLFYNNTGRIDSIKTIYYHGSKVLGHFNSSLVFLTLNDLPTHNAVRLEFDLYIHDKWEGDKIAPGYTLPDFWTIALNGFTIYLSTFSNDPNYKQSFPNKFTGAPSTNPARADAWALTPGICSYGDRPDGSAMYKIDYTTAHSGSINLIMGDLIQGASSYCTKSWSIDNLRVTAINYK